MFRNILSACEAHGSHSIRLILTYQFAEFLLRKVSPKYYSLPTINSKFFIIFIRQVPTIVSIIFVLAPKKQLSSMRKPKKYNTINMFMPRSEHEEIILLLIIR